MNNFVNIFKKCLIRVIATDGRLGDRRFRRNLLNALFALFTMEMRCVHLVDLLATKMDLTLTLTKSIGGDVLLFLNLGLLGGAEGDFHLVVIRELLSIKFDGESRTNLGKLDVGQLCAGLFHGGLESLDNDFVAGRGLDGAEDDDAGQTMERDFVRTGAAKEVREETFGRFQRLIMVEGVALEDEHGLGADGNTGARGEARNALVVRNFEFLHIQHLVVEGTTENHTERALLT